MFPVKNDHCLAGNRSCASMSEAVFFTTYLPCVHWVLPIVLLIVVQGIGIRHHHHQHQSIRFDVQNWRFVRFARSSSTNAVRNFACSLN